MKWPYIVLFILGVVAALAAAALVHSLYARRLQREHREEVQIICAAKALPAMTIVDASCITTKTVRKDQMPAGSFTESIHVVGKVLIVPMVQGQAFTSDCLASEDSSLQLASALPEGMRAVTIRLEDDSSLCGILFPGNTVDVLALFPAPAEPGSPREEVAIVLAEGVHVLAIDEQTVASSDRRGAPASADRKRPRLVTLMLDTAHALALQLADKSGQVTLTLRNPSDAKPVTEKPATLRSLYEEHFPPGLELAKVEPEPEPAPPVAEWRVSIIRGSDRETQIFPVAPRTHGRPER